MTPRPYNPDSDCKDTKRMLVDAYKNPGAWARVIRDAPEFLASILDAETTSEEWGNAAREALLVVAQSQWTKTKGVYQFSPELSGVIGDMMMDGLEDVVFRYLPESSVYISLERQMADGWWHGGYVCSVRFPLDPDEVWVISLAVKHVAEHRRGYWFDAAMFRANASQPLTFKERARLLKEYDQTEFAIGTLEGQESLHPVHQLLLLHAAYLCTAEPDLRCPREPKIKPSRKVNNGPVRQWEVGFRFGAAFRKQLEEAEARARTVPHTGSERQRPRVHVRRAHWHTFLSGPRDQERRREVKFIPPIIINAEGGALPVVVWKKK